MSVNPKIGDKLNIRITKILPIGLGVELDDGRQGVIRNIRRRQ